MRFFEAEMQDRSARSRYWIVQAPLRDPAGIAALTGIEWENGLCECSIILAPEWQRHGIGTQVFEQLKRHAFYTLRLQMVIAEVYEHNPTLKFWEKQACGTPLRSIEWHADPVRLRNRKFSNGVFYDSIVFQFHCDQHGRSIRSEPGFSYYQSSDHK